mgnify:CR=1 FL=1
MIPTRCYLGRILWPVALTLSSVLALVACDNPGPISTPPLILPTQTVISGPPTPLPTLTLAPTVTPTPAPPGSFVPTAASYVLDITVDYENHTLAARETVIFTNTLGVPLTELRFYVPPNHTPGTLFLESLSVHQASLPPTFVYDLQADDLRLPFETPLQAGQIATVEMSFTVKPPRMRTTSIFGGGGLGWSENALNAGNWYPVLRPYQAGKGWYVFKWHAIGDPYVTDWADYQATIIAPQHVIVVGNGDLTRRGTAWSYRLRGRSFAFTASHRYQSGTAPAGDATVESYWFPEHESVGRLVLTETARCLMLYADLFGPYPYAALRIAETDFNGGQEFSGITFLGSGVYADHLKSPQGPRTILYTLIPHETAHQWWFGLVGSDQCREPWLDEALVQYSEMFFYERFYPADAAYRWEWMGNTVRRPGPINGTIYDYSKERPYKDAIYLTGALFIGRLRETLGDERFFAFLRDYAAGYRGRLATTADFFAVLDQHATPEEIAPLRQVFFP